MNRNNRHYDPASVVVWLLIVPVLLVTFWGAATIAAIKLTSSPAQAATLEPAKVQRWMTTPCAYEVARVDTDTV